MLKKSGRNNLIFSQKSESCITEIPLKISKTKFYSVCCILFYFVLQKNLEALLSGQIVRPTETKKKYFFKLL